MRRKRLPPMRPPSDSRHSTVLRRTVQQHTRPAWERRHLKKSRIREKATAIVAEIIAARPGSALSVLRASIVQGAAAVIPAVCGGAGHRLAALRRRDPHCAWRTSASATAAAFDTLRLGGATAAAGAASIRAGESQVSAVRRRRPVPSAPSTSTVGVRPAARTSGASASRPTTQ